MRPPRFRGCMRPLGLLTVVSALWLVLQMNDILPERWHVSWWKTLMRFTLAGYWAVSLLGMRALLQMERRLTASP